MQAVLCALNAKYIHTNLAVRYIGAYIKKHAPGIAASIVEETIHAKPEDIFARIMEHSPRAVAFSCYIWNIKEVLFTCQYIRARHPEITLILGGPEVSYNPEEYLSYPFVDYVQCGEGEKPMTALLVAIERNELVPEHFGICYQQNGENVLSPLYTESDLDSLESPYTDEYLSAVSGRLAYFEASRGCPFSCAFCLSGGTRGVRHFSMDYVKKSLIALWQSGVRTVKFVDRTFNANKERADEIISFILAHYEDMPKVCFHFEIAADILKESTMQLLSLAPKGLFQIEAGIQSFHPETLAAVTRKNSLDKVCQNVQKVISFQNIHTHVDLIAGLPYEDFHTFRDSFNSAFSLKAHMLQLGFLKLLHGSRLRAEKKQHGFLFLSCAPYTVKSTKWLTENEMRRLEDVEDANEKIYNSHRFERSLSYVLEVTGISPFDLFAGFGKRDSMPLDSYTDELFAYFSALPGVDMTQLRDLMCLDRLSTNNSGKLPKSLKIKDARLGDIAHALEQTRKKNVKRAVCILYQEEQVVYADYEKGKEPPYALAYKQIADFEKDI